MDLLLSQGIHAQASHLTRWALLVKLIRKVGTVQGS
jgi:hypothetical protein